WSQRSNMPCVLALFLLFQKGFITFTYLVLHFHVMCFLWLLRTLFDVCVRVCVYGCGGVYVWGGVCVCVCVCVCVGVSVRCVCGVLCFVVWVRVCVLVVYV